MNRIAIGAHKYFDDVADHLQRGIHNLCAAGMVTGRRMLGEVAYFTVEWELDEDSERVKNLLSTALTELITYVWVRKDIERQIMQEHTYYDADEIQYLTERAVSHLACYRRTHYSAQRKIEIELMLRKYLEEHCILQLEGFIRFRLKELEQDRCRAIELAIDQYLTDREYQDFISVLRSFLKVQAPRVPLVHLLIGHGWNQLRDQNGLPMSDDCAVRLIDDLFENAAERDDRLLSVLISLAPQTLQIHIPNEPLADSILYDTATRVFEQRSQICRGCPLCRAASDIGIMTVT